MSDMNLGKHAATRQSWARDSIRQIFHEIQEENPKAADDWRKMANLLRDRCLADPSTLDAASDYIAINLTRAQEGYEHRAEEHAPRRRIERTPEQEAERKAAIAKAAEETVAHILLLNQQSPVKGKLWRYVTKEELGPVKGGLGKLYNRMKPGQMIGQAVNEDEFRELLGQ